MFCPECGEAVDASAKFCPSCGKRLGAVNAAVPVRTSNVPEQGAEDPPDQVSLPSVADSNPPPKKGTTKRSKWVTAAWVMVVAGFLLNYLGYAGVGNLLLILAALLAIAWAVGSFVMQRKTIKPEIYSKAMRNEAIILGLGLLVYMIVQMQPNTGSGNGNGASLILGTSFNRQSSELTVSGTGYRADHYLYARVFSPQAFGTTSLSAMLQEKIGSGWSMVFNQSFTVNPQDDIVVEPLIVTSGGRYQLTILNGNQVMDVASFTVSP